jgi:DNA-binding FadR family transcriptional regulator
MRAADYVFETLSHAILNGELSPGSVLATQRELSQQFEVSPLVVRQATHRLEELGLVRVRQGSTTIVLDPNEASDVRLMQLQLELATPGDRLALAAVEMQVLSTLPLLALAQRRITPEELQQLETWVDALPERPSPRESLAFRLQFWGLIARATRNPVVQQQMRWWSRVVRDLETKRAAGSGGEPVHGSDGPGSALPSVYRKLTRALRRKRGAVESWHRVMTAVFDVTEAQPSHPMHGQSETSSLARPARNAR